MQKYPDHVNTFYEKLKFFSSYQKMTPIKLSLSKIKIISYWKKIVFFFYTNQIVPVNKEIIWYVYFVLIYDIKSNLSFEI